MSLEKALTKLIQQATAPYFTAIADDIDALKEKQTNSSHNLTTKINKLTMSQKTDFQAILGRLDAATNSEAQKLKDLQDKVLAAITNGGMTVEEENEIKAEFEAKIAFLEGLGKPENPVPDPIPSDPTPVDPIPTEPAPPVEGPAPTDGGETVPPVEGGEVPPVEEPA